MTQVGNIGNAESKIYIADSELSKIDNFKTTNGSCTVKYCTYRNRPNKYVYITINTKTHGHNLILLECIDETFKLSQDLKECHAFINKLKKENLHLNVKRTN